MRSPGRLELKEKAALAALVCEDWNGVHPYKPPFHE
jgi:hypothetical protein